MKWLIHNLLIFAFIFLVFKPLRIMSQGSFSTASPTFNYTSIPVYVHGVPGTGVTAGLYIGKGNGTSNASSIAFGINSLLANISGQHNIAMGRNALALNTTGEFNLAIGTSTLTANTIGVSNTAIGYEALKAYAPTGSVGGNVAVGHSSFANLVQGVSNVAIGTDAGKRLATTTASNRNVAIGKDALTFFLTSSDNTACGFTALKGVDGGGATAISTGSLNSAFGVAALAGITSGSNNVGVGYTAGSAITNGNFNLALGWDAQVQFPAGSNQLSIQKGIHGSFMNDPPASRVGIGLYPVGILPGIGLQPAGTIAKLHVDGSGTIPSLRLNAVPGTTALAGRSYLFVDAAGIVTQAPLPAGTGGGIANDCSVAGFIPRVTNLNGTGNLGCSQVTDDGTTTVQIGTNAVGPITFSGTAAAALPSGAPTIVTGNPIRLFVQGWALSNGFYSTSDERLKENIKKIESPLLKISLLNGYTYDWNSNHKSVKELGKTRQAGFLAQELNKVLPEAVILTDENIYAVNYNSILPFLTEGIKEQQAQIETLKMEIENLKQQLSDNNSKNEKMVPVQNSMLVAQFEVAPNPVTGVSIVSYNLDNKANARAFLIITDLQGKMMKQLLLKNNEKGQVEISKTDLRSGMYIFSIVSGNAEIQSKKVMVAE